MSSLRFFTVFAPRHRPDMAFHIFCRAALETQPITVFGDGRHTRAFTYVDDGVAATLAAGTAELANDRSSTSAAAPRRRFARRWNSSASWPEGASTCAISSASTETCVTRRATPHPRANLLGFHPQTSLEEVGLLSSSGSPAGARPASLRLPVDVVATLAVGVLVVVDHRMRCPGSTAPAVRGG